MPGGDTKFLFECCAHSRYIFFNTRSDNVIFYLLINTNEIPNHFTSIVFWCEWYDLLYYAAIATVIISHVKIP